MASEYTLGASGLLAIVNNPSSNPWGGGTPTAPGAGHGVPIDSEALKRIDQKQDNEELVRQEHRRAPHHIGFFHEGPVTMQGDYNYLTTMLAHACYDNAVVEDEAGVRYTHTMLPKPLNAVGVNATVAVDRKIDVTGSDGTTAGWQWAHAKLNGFELAMELGDHVRGTFPLIARDLQESIDLSGVTYPYDPDTQRQFAMLGDAVMRVNVQSAGALGSGDEILLPTSVGMTYEPNVRGDLKRGGVDEPIPRERPVTRLVCTFARATQALKSLFLAAYKGAYALKADLILTGNQLGTGNFGLSLEFPFLRVDNDPDPALETGDLVPFEVELHAQQATAAPTGMDVTDPFRIKLTNAVATSPLA